MLVSLVSILRSGSLPVMLLFLLGKLEHIYWAGIMQAPHPGPSCFKVMDPSLY